MLVKKWNERCFVILTFLGVLTTPQRSVIISEGGWTGLEPAITVSQTAALAS